MPLSRKQLETIGKTLDPKLKNACPICGERHWEIEEELLFMPVVDPKTMRAVPDKSKAIIMINCANCYFSFLVPEHKFDLGLPS